MLRRMTAGILFAGGLFLFTPSARGASVTFEHDVQPIFTKHCVDCHAPGKVAPMSFVTYKDTKPWSAKIKTLVTSKGMPPSVGTAHLSVLTRGEGLTDAEIKTLVAWVDAGSPEGTAAKSKKK